MRTQRSDRWALLVPILAGLFIVAPANAAGGLVLIPDGTLLLVMVAFFAVLIFPMNQLIFKPIFAALDERDARIAGAKQRAEHIQAEANAVLERYESAIRNARIDSESTRKQQVSDAREEQGAAAAAARSEAEQQIERARAELASSLGDARATLRDTSEELAREAASQILGRPL